MSTAETWLILEPHDTAGIAARLFSGGEVLHEVSIGAKEDSVVAITKLLGRARIAGVMVRGHIGSFSASRASLVIANVLSATRNVPIFVTELPLKTPAEILAAHEAKTTPFSYAAPPHITTPA